MWSGAGGGKEYDDARKKLFDSLRLKASYHDEFQYLKRKVKRHEDGSVTVDFAAAVKHIEPI